MRTRIYAFFLVVSTTALAMDWGDLLKEESWQSSKSSTVEEHQAQLNQYCLEEKANACFNLSSIKAREGNFKEALLLLEQSFKLGFNDWNKLEDEQNFKSLRETDDYKSLVSFYKRS